MKNIRKILSKFCKSIEHIYRKLTETLDKLGKFRKIWEKIKQFLKTLFKILNFAKIQNFRNNQGLYNMYCTQCTVHLFHRVNECKQKF